VPSDGALFPNIAYDQAKVLIPAGNATTLGATYNEFGSFGSGLGKERTDKGGLHIATRHNGDLSNNVGAGIRVGTSIAQYIQDNPDNDYFFSIWNNITRPHVTVNSSVPAPVASIYNSSNATSDNLFSINVKDGVVFPSPNDRLGAYEHQDFSQSGANLHNVGISDFTGTAANISTLTVLWGAISAWGYFVSQSDDATPSSALYRIYLEDLTVSGRTYAEVHALDLALFTKEVLNTGGKYHNDTFTAPATLAGG
jgi:hypothetical protein